MGIGRDFIKATSGIDFSAYGRMQGEPQPPLELPFEPKTLVDLPRPESIVVNPLDLRDAIEKRRSVRSYSDSPLSIEELSYLLWCTQGIQEYFTFRGEATKRTVPSAGGMHALDTYLAVHRVETLQEGLYRYIASQHKLSLIEAGEAVFKRVADAQGKHLFVYNSAVIFVWAARTDVMYWHQGERGYRNLFLDAGHVGQNLYLACEQTGCGICEICVFDDNEQNNAIGVDGEQVTAILAASVGKKK